MPESDAPGFDELSYYLKGSLAAWRGQRYEQQGGFAGAVVAELIDG